MKIILLVGFIFWSTISSAATRYVDNTTLLGFVGCAGILNTHFSTLQSAINAANAGDTISVCDGTYNENNIRITKSNLTIKSYSGNRANVTVKSTSSPTFTIQSSNITLQNISIQSSGYGITNNYQSSGSHTFDNLAITSVSDGIYLDLSGGDTFKNLAITSTAGQGINLAYNAYGAHTFSGVNLTSYGNGISVNHSSALSFTDVNATSSTGMGIYSIGGATHTLSGINLTSYDSGISINTSTTLTLSNLNIKSTNGAGIYAANGITSLQNFAITSSSYGIYNVLSQNISIQNGTITATSGNGIEFVWGSQRSVNLQYLTINSGGRGINLPVSSSATMDHLCINASTYGIYADWNAYNVSVSNSKIEGNSNHGIYISSSPSNHATITSTCFQSSPFASRNDTAHTFNGNYWNGTPPSGYDSSPLSSCPVSSCYGQAVSITPSVDYRFDECRWNGTTGEIDDNSTNSYNSTPKSANGTAIPQVSAQIINNGTLFARASQQYIQLPTLALNAPNFNNGFSVTAWAKFSGSAGSWERIFDIGNGTNVNNIFLGRQGVTSNLVLGIHDPGTSQYLVANGAISDTNWHFWGATCDGSRGCKLYKDGIKIAESTTMKIPANVARTTNYIGKSNWSADAYLEGGVDEFKIFDSVLSVSEISSIYNNELIDKNYDGTARGLLCCCLPTGGNLIANPSFETLCGTSIIETWNGVEGGTVNMRNNVCGWNMNGSGMETWENTTTKPASNGSVFVEIDGYSSTVDQLSQTLNALNGVHYVISFDYRARDGGSDRIIAKWNGTQIGTFTGVTTGWQTAQIEVVGTGADILAFEEPSADNNALGSWIDNIRVAEGTLITNCTSFAYDLFHTSTPSNKLYTRISNQPFDVNATVVCAGSGDIPSRKITKIYAVTGATCPTATTGLPVLWSGSIDINQTSPIVTIPNLNTLKAYSSTRLMLETNASELNCSSDTLSIRPARYTMTSPSSIIAGNPFNLTFKALGYADATISDYNTTVNLIKTLSDPTKICSVSDGDLTDENNVSITGSTFNDSISTITNARFNEIGLYNINLKDTTWTAIDQNVDCIPDSNSTILSGITAKVGCNIEDNTTITVTPHHFDVNATLSNFDDTTFTYLSNDLNISAQLDLNITAKSANNKVLKNYDDTCYSKNTTITLPHSTVPNPLTKILYTESLSSVNTNVLKTNPWVLTFNADSFNNGSVSPTIHFNFDRNSSVPLNPFDFNITSVSATDADISGTTTPLGSAKFVYGRVRAYDIATNVSPVNVPIEFEVYSTTPSGFVSGMPQNILKWYRNLDHDTAAEGNVIRGGFSAGATEAVINTSSAPNNGLQIVNITSVEDKTIHLNISSWLWYSPKTIYDYSGGCTQHPCFTYDFTDTSVGTKGVSSGTFQGSDFQMAPAKNITNKGVKIFR